MSYDRTSPPAAAQGRTTVHLPEVGAELLEAARASSAGRAARTLTPGAGAPLKQTLLALVGGQHLADHDSPRAATLQVLQGVVRLTGAGEELALHEGDHAPIPPARHGLHAVDDAVVLLSVSQGS